MELQNIITEQFNNIISTEDLNTLSEDAARITGGLSKEYNISNILDTTISGEGLFNYEQLINTFKSLFLLELKSALILCVEILSVCIIIGVLKGLSTSFSSKSVSEISVMTCTMTIIAISIKSFQTTYNLAFDTVNIMTNTMEIITPILIGILISTGSIASGTILSPTIIGAITFVSFCIKKIILPLLFVATLLTLVNCLTEKNYVNKLSKLLRNTAVTLIGFLLVILSGIISIQGVLAETSDGILINTAKFSINNFVPIVGGFTSDTIDLFIKCMSTIKSMVGIFGIVLLTLLMAFPLIKILVISLIYKLTSALVEPITDSKISDGLNEMGTCVISIASIVFFNSLLFIIFITTIINLGGS